MSTYLVLIHGDEQYWESQGPDERAAKEEAHAAFAARAGTDLIDGRELRATRSARTLRATGTGPGDEPMLTDGPFAETKEVLGGYYLLRATDLDAAIELAGHLPELREPGGAVEIRPVVERD